MHDVSEGHQWEPSPGAERTTYTALGTILTGIAFAAIALGLAVALGQPLGWRRGLLLGAMGFVTFVVAPSIGLRPKPPGVPGAEVQIAQAGWALAVVCTSAAFAILLKSGWRGWGWVGAMVLLVLPHAVGAPPSAPSTLVPVDLVNRFAWLSVVSRLPFWLLLGAIGGHFLRNAASDDASVAW
jgi:cobalt transporter subunit CbtA